jgi:uncharacterized Zn finger protein (UPF0148 family)
MSSDDSEFDKEAEREKLREKYGDDDENRENTRRMSELLLQGATMTGKHCDNCGDPIFRYDGREFCPTCQHEAQQAQSANADANQSGEAAARSPQTDGAADAADTAKTADAADKTDPDTDRGTADQRADDEPRVEINDVRVGDRHADRSSVRRPPSQTQDHAPASDRVQDRNSAQDHNSARGAQAHDHAHRHGQNARGASDRDAGDLAPPRESLVRTLSDLARRAEETDDAGRARELLAATREAAEALAALDRANR